MHFALRAILLSSLAFGLVACGGPRRSAPAPQVAVQSARFDDADPTEWPGRKPGSYPVHGIDISRFQSVVDWPTARAAGVNFAFVKATEGGDGADPLFDVNWRGAAQAGVRRGAYHFFYHCRPASEQARWFIAHVPRSPGALPPVLDMEWTPFSPTCTVRHSGAHIREEIAEYSAIIRAHYGQSPIIYTTVDFYADTELWRLPQTEFWLRSVATHPAATFKGQHWTFWQYTGTGLVPGIAGQVDINAFAGSERAWAHWLAVRAP